MFCYKLTLMEEGNLNYYPRHRFITGENVKEVCERAESIIKKNIECKNLEITNCELVGKAL